MRKPIGISACLLGDNCRYDGGSCEIPDIRLLYDRWIPVCPEVTGGLPTPRPPAELTRPSEKIFQSHTGVVSITGEDVSEYFIAGAKTSLTELQSAGCKVVILKSHSPSCGAGKVCDGSFSGKFVKMNGVFAQLCINNGITVISSDSIEAIHKVVRQ